MATRSVVGTARRKRRAALKQRSRGVRRNTHDATVQPASGPAAAPAGIDVGALANSLGTGLAGEVLPVVRLLADQNRELREQLQEERQARLGLEFTIGTARLQLEEETRELRGRLAALEHRR